MIFRSSTNWFVPEKYLCQLIFDSEQNTYFVVLYTATGNKMKHCKKGYSVKEAEDNAFDYCKIAGLV